MLFRTECLEKDVRDSRSGRVAGNASYVGHLLLIPLWVSRVFADAPTAIDEGLDDITIFRHLRNVHLGGRRYDEAAKRPVAGDLAVPRTAHCRDFRGCGEYISLLESTKDSPVPKCVRFN